MEPPLCIGITLTNLLCDKGIIMRSDKYRSIRGMLEGPVATLLKEFTISSTSPLEMQAILRKLKWFLGLRYLEVEILGTFGISISVSRPMLTNK